MYRTELVNKDGISMFFGDGSTYLPWIFVANIINAMIVDGDYPGDFTQLFEEARKILEKAEYVVSDEYLMTAVLELQKKRYITPPLCKLPSRPRLLLSVMPRILRRKIFRRLLRRLNIQTIRKMCLPSLLRYRKRQKESREQNRIYRHEITAPLQSSFPILFQENTAL